MRLTGRATFSTTFFLLLIAYAARTPAEQSAEELFLQGVKAYRELQVEGAEQALRQAAEISQQRGEDDPVARALAAQVYLYLGRIAVLTARPDLAHAHFLEALRLNPHLTMSTEGDPPKIVSVFDEARNQALWLLPPTPTATAPPTPTSTPSPTATSTPTPLPAAGTIVDVIPAPGRSPAGLAWDGTHLWVADPGQARIFKVSPKGEVVASFQPPGKSPEALAWDGASLWVADRSASVVFRIAPDGHALASFPLRGDPRGLAWIDPYLFCAEDDDEVIYLLRPIMAERRMAVVTTRLETPGSRPRGLAWDGEHLWHVDAGSKLLYKLRVRGSTLETAAVMPLWEDAQPHGVAWDGLFIRILDTDSRKIYRISVSGMPG